MYQKFLIGFAPTARVAMDVSWGSNLHTASPMTTGSDLGGGHLHKMTILRPTKRRCFAVGRKYAVSLSLGANLLLAIK